MRPIPENLHGRPFTATEALSLGVTRQMLRSSRFVTISRGVFRTADTEPTFELAVAAARLTLPPGAILSHHSSLRWRGLAIGPPTPVHFASNHRHQSPRSNVVLHRYRGAVLAEFVRGVPVTPPERTFVDVATIFGRRELLQIGDWLVAQQLTTPDEIRQFVAESHLDGVQRARKVAELVRAGVASPRESDVRWYLHLGGLPAPEVNVDIVDDQGRWLARGDLVYRSQKVLVEYDGWQHERDARQRQWDHLRREHLEAAGWRLVVITAADFERPHLIAPRVRQALAGR